MTTKPDQHDLVREAKAIVALAFRNGPIEDLHAGRPCTACEGKAGYSRISDARDEGHHEKRGKPGLQAAPAQG